MKICTNEIYPLNYGEGLLILAALRGLFLGPVTSYGTYSIILVTTVTTVTTV